MRSLLPFLIAFLLLIGQVSCTDGTGGGGAGSSGTPQPLQPDQPPDGGGGSPSPTPPMSGTTFPADPNCTGDRTVFVGINANVLISLDNGNQVLKTPDADGNLSIPCTASYTVYR